MVKKDKCQWVNNTTSRHHLWRQNCSVLAVGWIHKLTWPIDTELWCAACGLNMWVDMTYRYRTVMHWLWIEYMNWHDLWIQNCDVLAVDWIRELGYVELGMKSVHLEKDLAERHFDYANTKELWGGVPPLLDLFKNRFLPGDQLQYNLCCTFSACTFHMKHVSGPQSYTVCKTRVCLFTCKGLNQHLHTNNFLQVTTKY